MRPKANAARYEDDAARLTDFVDSLLPVIQPCVLISFAVFLLLLTGPQSSDHTHASVSAESHLGGRAAAAVVAHSRASRSRNGSCAIDGSDGGKSTNRSARCAQRKPWRSCTSCMLTAQIVRALDTGPANPLLPADRANRTQLPCPGLAGALGSHVGRRAGRSALAAAAAATSTSGTSSDASSSVPGRGGWLEACGVQHRGRSQWMARASVRGRTPLVYVYDFLDDLHSELLAHSSARSFFDPWHPHNQFL